MVSRTAVAILAVVALAAGVQSQTDGSNNGQLINKFVPLTVEISSTGAANLVVTPPTITRPTQLATGNAELTALVAFTKTQNLYFNAEIKQTFGTELASEDFIFNNQSLPFLERVTAPAPLGTYKFVQALIYTPQEPNPIPFVSTTGFLNADLSPFVAHINTQNATITVPNVAVRFDYTQTVAGAAAPQAVSLFYTDRPATNVTTTPTVTTITKNLQQTFGIYINDMNQVTVGTGLGGTSSITAPAVAANTPQNSGAGSTPVSPTGGRKLFERLFRKKA